MLYFLILVENIFLLFSFHPFNSSTINIPYYPLEKIRLIPQNWNSPRNFVSYCGPVEFRGCHIWRAEGSQTSPNPFIYCWTKSAEGCVGVLPSWKRNFLWACPEGFSCNSCLTKSNNLSPLQFYIRHHHSLDIIIDVWNSMSSSKRSRKLKILTGFALTFQTSLLFIYINI